MTGSILRRGLAPAVALCVAACGAGDRATPSSPSAVQSTRTPDTRTPGVGVALPAESSGTKPVGFDSSIRVNPKPDEDGIIRGNSPLEVEIDVCQSKQGEGAPLTYLLDWNFDSFADAAATGDDCVFTHRFAVPVGATGAARSLRANVCVVSGNPNVKGPDTYFSCRALRFELVPEKEKVLRILDDSLCVHSACASGSVLAPGCSPCVADICAVDPFCCDTAWDGICVNEVKSVCNYDACVQGQNLTYVTEGLASQRRP